MSENTFRNTVVYTLFFIAAMLFAQTVFAQEVTRQGDWIAKPDGGAVNWRWPSGDWTLWTWEGLTPGDYHVHTTWRSHERRATNAPFTLYGSDRDKGLTVRIDQRNASEADLGVVECDGTLRVRLTDDANGSVYAGQVTLTWIEPDEPPDEPDDELRRRIAELEAEVTVLTEENRVLWEERALLVILAHWAIPGAEPENMRQAYHDWVERNVDPVLFEDLEDDS